MQFIRRVIGASAAAVIMLGGWTQFAPASATGTGSPIFLEPNGSTVMPHRWSGPFTVDFTNAPVDRYRLRLSCPPADGDDGYEWSSEVYYDGTNNVVTRDVPAIDLSTFRRCDAIATGVLEGGYYSNNIGFSINGQEAGGPGIVSPAENAFVLTGWAGPVTVDLTGAPLGEYTARISTHADDSEIGDTDYDEQVTIYGGNYEAATFPALPRQARYWIEVWDNATQTFYASHMITAVNRRLQVTRATAPDFYPTVRDRYRDTATISYTLNQAATVGARITDEGGRTVHRLSPRRQGSGRNTLSWNGRRSNGALAKPGRYTIDLDAVTSLGDRHSALTAVHLRTQIVTKRGSTYKAGDSGRASTQGNCFVHWDTYDEAASLDCWGGRHATVKYVVRVPRNATDLRWDMYSERSTSDICCRGTINETGKRTSPTTFTVTARVTGWRALDVGGVEIKYRYKARI